MKRRLSPTNWIGVLISWAMPAASCPMASSFCVCREWFSAIFLSVMSSFTAKKWEVSPVLVRIGLMTTDSQ